jgi:2-(1,2-epoxy-1,2-dihydrophenyl)acetyl-CoA isomerase
MNSEAKLLVTTEGGVRRITFNNPARRNALSLDTFALFAEAVEEAARDESRVVVITGAGDSFCGGLDLTSLSPEELARLDVAAKIRELINPPILRLRALRKPVVARVNGHVAGIGFSYVLASDVRVSTSDATFSQSFIRVGLMPDGGATHLLPALVGTVRAFELMTTGAPISAHDALGLGLLNRVVPREELDAAVDAVVAQLATAPQPALARIKAALARREHEALAAALDFEAEGQADCFRSPDFAEGVAAFMRKRAPEFGKGRG